LSSSPSRIKRRGGEDRTDASYRAVPFRTIRGLQRHATWIDAAVDRFRRAKQSNCLRWLSSSHSDRG
jgi:hypothetical protein